ncbi:glutamate racemase [Brevibacterium otitidis]|uniref:Glutamate racemase n=1 Tax=Brevibacterium otitidis TaxID=53364 RepID=A0ABV5X1C4_9MICO|nr:aspartate/glutamate racemase family protein [Brevibacterium otitidis]
MTSSPGTPDRSENPARAESSAHPGSRTRPVIGLIDSGLGLVSYADALHHQYPEADLVLAMDPDWMPYGSLDPEVVAERALSSANALSPWEPDAIVVACNTASVHALERLREAYEPRTPIIGTVPAIKTAAATGEEFAVWATRATTRSAYQESLITEFAGDATVHQVPCYGLADAIDAADEQRIDETIAAAVAATPPAVSGIVLGCTHFGLVADRILQQRPGTSALFDSPHAVARQTLARLGLSPVPEAAQAPGTSGTAGTAGARLRPSEGRVLATYMSGRRAGLPDTLDAYPAGVRLRAIEN